MATNTGETSARISKPTDNCTNEANHFNSVNSIKMIIEFYAMSSFINCWSVAQKGGRIEMYKDRPRLWQKLTVDRYIFHCRSFIRSCVIFIFHTCAYFNPHNWQWCLKQSWRHARTIRNMANWKMKRKKMILLFSVSTKAVERILELLKRFGSQSDDLMMCMRHSETNKAWQLSSFEIICENGPI